MKDYKKEILEMTTEINGGCIIDINHHINIELF